MLKLSTAAAKELRRITVETPGERLGVVLYWSDGEATLPQEPVEPAVWETVESRGWKLSIVAVSHLPGESLTILDGVELFVALRTQLLELNFDGTTFLVDDEPCDFDPDSGATCGLGVIGPGPPLQWLGL